VWVSGVSLDKGECKVSKEVIEEGLSELKVKNGKVVVVKKKVGSSMKEGLFSKNEVMKELGLSEVWVGRCFREKKKGFENGVKIGGKWYLDKEGLEIKRELMKEEEENYKERVESGRKGYGVYEGVKVKGLRSVLKMVKGNEWEIEEELRGKIVEVLEGMLSVEVEEWESRKEG